LVKKITQFKGAKLAGKAPPSTLGKVILGNLPGGKVGLTNQDRYLPTNKIHLP